MDFSILERDRSSKTKGIERTKENQGGKKDDDTERTESRKASK